MSIKERLSLAKEPIYLVDGTAYVYRAYHATRDMARSDGFPHQCPVYPPALACEARQGRETRIPDFFHGRQGA